MNSITRCNNLHLDFEQFSSSFLKITIRRRSDVVFFSDAEEVDDDTTLVCTMNVWKCVESLHK